MPLFKADDGEDAAVNPIFTAGLQVYWRSTDLEVNGSGFVTRLIDLSGNGNDATGSSGPQRVLDTLAGNSVLRFNGNNQYLSHPYLGQPTTVLALIRDGNAGGANQTLMGASSNNSSLSSWYLRSSDPFGNASFIFVDNSNNVRASVLPYVLRNWIVLIGRLQNSSLELFLNSYKATPGDLPSTTEIITPAVLGATAKQGGISEYWLGDVAEVAIFNQALTSAKIGEIVTYLKSVYHL